MGWLFNAGKAKSQAAQTPAYTGIPIQTSAYGKVIPVVYGTTRISANLLWYGDFVQTPHQSTAGGGGGKGGGVGGGGGKGGGGSVDYTYSAAVAMGLCEGPIVGVGNVYVDKNIVTLASLGFSLFTGTYPQTPWSYLTSKHAGQDLGYNGIGYIAASSLQLGSSPNLSNYNMELQGIYSASITAQVDADPSLILPDVLANPRYGVGFPSALVGDLTAWQAYCIANGLWMSPAYTDAQQSATLVQALAAVTNSEFFFSSGKLNITPYGDTAITANGYTYTPVTTPLFDLNDDDYLPNQGSQGSGDPVALQRLDPADAYNQVQLEYLDRSNNYNPAIAEAKDQAAIDQYGLRSMPNVAAHMLCDGAAARLAAQLILQRQAIRNLYQWTTDLRYVVLDPMDIVTLTDTGLGLNKQPVRIRQMDLSQDDQGNTVIVFTAEEFLGGVSNAPAYSFANGSGYTVNYNVSPGNVNAPVIFEPPVQITTTGLEVWMGISGIDLTNWGGCQVWISSDGTNYALAGTVKGAAREGALTADLPSAADPDTTNTLGVSLAMSGGELLSGTQADADANHTLCHADGELISYQTATLTGANAYNLTYLRRGQYGSVISAHASGTPFLRLDGGVFTYSYDKSLVGKTLFVKFLSFNKYLGGIQNLADVASYSYTIVGPPVARAVQNFAAAQSGNVVVFTWDDLLTDSGLKGYDIAYGAPGSSWAQKQLLTEAARATEMTNAAVPPGTWEFSIRGHDLADNLGAETLIQNFTVINSDPLITNVMQEPAWPGDLVGGFVHYTGVLVPQGSYPTSLYDLILPPAAPTLSQVAGGSLTLTTYYAKITYSDATGETLASAEASLLVSPLNLLRVASPPAVTGATTWAVYVGTSSGAETLQAAGIGIGANWTMPASGLVAGTGVPLGNTTGQGTFNLYVPDPVATMTYTAPTVDTGIDDYLRVYASMAASLGYGNTVPPSLSFAIDTWLTAGVDTGVYVPWTVGTVQMRYLRGRISVTGIVQGAVPYITDFTPSADKAPSVETSTSFVVAPGGSTLTFAPPFHFAPFVQSTVISTTALSSSVSAVTATTCHIDVWNTAGTSVGGTVNITAIGE